MGKTLLSRVTCAPVVHMHHNQESRHYFTSVHMCSLISAGHNLHPSEEQLCKQMFFLLLILLTYLKMVSG